MKKKGIWVDASLSGLGLSPLDKLLYSQIEYLSKDRGFCDKSDRAFAKDLEVSARSISASLSFLEKIRLITKSVAKHKGNERKIFAKKIEDARCNDVVLVEEVEFSASELYDFEAFGMYMGENYQGLNVSYYYNQVRVWENDDGTKPKRKNWKNVINSFISNDMKNGKIVKENEQQRNSSNEWSATDTLRGAIEILQSKRR